MPDIPICLPYCDEFKRTLILLLWRGAVDTDGGGGLWGRYGGTHVGPQPTGHIRRTEQNNPPDGSGTR